MLSTCPSCLAQVNHADHLFDVTCECGAHFSPFLNVENSGDYESPQQALAQQEPEGPKEFSESTNAFKEIVSFGETLTVDDVNSPIQPMPVMVEETPKSKAERSISPKPAGVPISTSQDGVILVSGTQLSDYQIVRYLDPISVLVDLDTGGTNPMQPAFQALSQIAQSLNATAVVGLSASLTGDGTRALLMGTPVQCTKLN